MSLQTFMALAVYGVYGVFLVVYVGMSAYAVVHVYKYRYLSPRTLLLTWFYCIASVALITLSLYLVLRLPL